MEKNKPIIISLGGSLIVPNGGIDTKFLKDFNAFIRKKIASKRRFFIVIGGGATARHYIKAAEEVAGDITDWDLDWLGIHSTRLNAHLVRTILRDIAHPRIVENYEKKVSDLKEKVVVASGWKPGHSTDYDAVVLALDYGAKMIINMSNTPGVYDKDPNKFKDARLLKKLSWDELEKMVGKSWRPGANTPFDAQALRLARNNNLTVYAVGKDLANLDKLLEGNGFVGTTIG